MTLKQAWRVVLTTWLVMATLFVTVVPVFAIYTAFHDSQQQHSDYRDVYCQSFPENC